MRLTQVDTEQSGVMAVLGFEEDAGGQGGLQGQKERDPGQRVRLLPRGRETINTVFLEDTKAVHLPLT